jgi:general secretion pathway protein G
MGELEPSMGRYAAQEANHRDRDAGFTLLELLVVIAILGLLIGLVAPAALRQLGSARISVAHQSIERLSSVLDLYKLDMGTYPSTEQGLQALLVQPSDASSWSGPYLKGDKTPQDPWNHPYIYRSPSTRQNHEYDLCSRGPSAAADATDDQMICNP